MYTQTSGLFYSEETDARKTAYWTTGRLSFVNTSFMDILKDIERKYNVKIHVESDKVRNEFFSGSIDVEKMSLSEMIERFSLDGISKSPSIFDEAKMRWLSGEYIKEMSDEEFVARGDAFFRKSKVYGKYDLKKIAALLKTRVETFGEIPEKIDFLEEFGEYDVALFTHKKMKTDENIARIVLPAARELFASLSSFDFNTLHEAMMGLVGKLGMKNGQVFWCVRVALSGRESTPGGVMELAELLGKEESLKRLDFSMKLLGL